MSIEITEVRNAKFITPNGDIDMEINHPEYGWIGYTLSIDDTDTEIDNANLKQLAEDSTGGIAALDQNEWEQKLSVLIRMQRNYILKEFVDPIVTNSLRWSELTNTQQQQWTNYRRLLLDITSQSDFPHSVSWPTKPE
jgi:hypothetical protein